MRSVAPSRRDRPGNRRRIVRFISEFTALQGYPPTAVAPGSPTTRREPEDGVEVPLVGRIAAGAPRPPGI